MGQAMIIHAVLRVECGGWGPVKWKQVCRYMEAVVKNDRCASKMHTSMPQKSGLTSNLDTTNKTILHLVSSHVAAHITNVHYK